MEHFVNRKELITSDNAAIRIFGLDKSTKQAHKNNRIKIHTTIDKMIAKNQIDPEWVKVGEFIPKNKKIPRLMKGYFLTYNAYKLVCMKLKPELNRYYLSLEELYFE